MKIFLYWLGAMAEVGIWMVFAFLLWSFTRMDAMEIIAITGIFSTGTMVFIFGNIDKILYSFKRMERKNDGRK